MKILFLTKVLWLACMLALAGQVASDTAPASRSDGKVNIGGILYTEEEMKDPVRRRKAELLAERVEEMRRLENEPVDYSGQTSQEIFGFLLISDGGGRHWKAGIAELARRPDDTKVMIDEVLNKREPFVHEFARLPIIAAALGKPYQIEITRRVIFHPAARQYDLAFVGQGDLLRYLEDSFNDETDVLDRLIAEGRLERGSELEMKWRKLLSSGNRVGRGTTRDGHGRHGENSGRTPKAGRDDRRLDMRQSLIVAVIAACILLIGLALIAWRKVRS